MADFIEQKRREHIEEAWVALSPEEKAALYSILIHGRPDNVMESTWLKLRAAHLVDGTHFYDAGGVRSEYRDLIADKFSRS